MKKITVTILFVFTAMLCFTACSEKNQPITLPKAEEVTSIEIAGGIEDIICTDKAVIAEFMQKISEAKLTNKQSVQDVPSVDVYTRVDFVYSGGMQSVFIYEDASKWFVEQPYQGIYETDETLLDLLKK